VKRLSLPARMRWAQGITLAAMLITAWLVGQWLTATFPWWVAFPSAFGVGWVLGWFTIAKVQPPLYRWLIRRWINEQPEHLRYLLHLRLEFELKEEE
jgi:hypothetical protein